MENLLGSLPIYLTPEHSATPIGKRLPTLRAHVYRGQLKHGNGVRVHSLPTSHEGDKLLSLCSRPVHWDSIGWYTSDIVQAIDFRGNGH